VAVKTHMGEAYNVGYLRPILVRTFVDALKERGCTWYDLNGVDPAANPGGYHSKPDSASNMWTSSGVYSRWCRASAAARRSESTTRRRVAIGKPSSMMTPSSMMWTD
jgi:hypothetical protein